MVAERTPRWVSYLIEVAWDLSEVPDPINAGANSQSIAIMPINLNDPGD
jgi:hypothetical protein